LDCAQGGPPRFNGKSPEAAQFYSIASSQCCFDLTENGVGDLPDIPREQMRILLGKALNQF
jgi:hypothetical protein